MHVIASINPLQPEQPESIHGRGGICALKMSEFVAWSQGEPLLWVNKNPHLFAKQLKMFLLRTGLGSDLPLPFPSHWFLTAPAAPATLTEPCQALAAVQGRDGLWFRAAGARHWSGYSMRVTLR